ncbi:EAL domain-containing protein [Paraburkholderia sp. RL17-337-BIB-A]|uniref:EAL domain-containing protein n=1 Tax=Paraburkholderia sp. RL17-337-BIB-A TaxID=3031636 RepID=UPI0038B7F2A0
MKKSTHTKMNGPTFSRGTESSRCADKRLPSVTRDRASRLAVTLLAAILPLALPATPASAGTPWADAGSGRDAFAGAVQRIARPILPQPPVVPLQFGAVCTLPPILLTPATLGGANAGPMEIVDIRQLHCLSLSDTSNVAPGDLVSLPESNAIQAPPMIAGALFILSRGPFSEGSAPPAPVSSLGVTVRSRESANPSLTPLLPTGCGQADACDWHTTPAPPGAETRSVRFGQPGAHPPEGARVSIGANLLSWVGLWLASWLALLGLFGLAWLFYKRRFAPDARLIRAARAGLRKGEFGLEYQPVVSLTDGRCVGVEALIRWNNAEYGSLGPAHYMSRLERTALIGPLTRFVLSTAARELGPLAADSSLYIGINVSSSHVESATFVSDVRRAATGILSRLVLHMPESRCAKPTANALNAFAALRAKKVRFALSNVGTGPGSHDILPAFAFELVKIDRQVLALDTDERGRRLTAVINVARRLGATVVAEGVESATHHVVVSQSGADFGQGFFYGRTMVLSLLRTFLEAGGTSLRAQKASVRAWAF